MRAGPLVFSAVAFAVTLPLHDRYVAVTLPLQARADGLAALASSRAFLHRGFRDIEMLLEAP